MFRACVPTYNRQRWPKENVVKTKKKLGSDVARLENTISFQIYVLKNFGKKCRTPGTKVLPINFFGETSHFDLQLSVLP